MKFNKTLFIAVLSLFAASGLMAKDKAKKEEIIPGMAPQPDSYFNELRAKQAQKEAASAAAQPAAQPVSFFYTGKPYDADLGAYTFKFRNYDPQTSRWTSADPSGFPDRANNQIYVPNPTAQLDPAGLTTVTYCDGNTSNGGGLGISVIKSPTILGSDSGAEMVIGWNPPFTLSGNGWVVQHVAFTLNVSNADGSSNAASNSANYYEAWRVSNNVVIDSDTFMYNGIPQNTYGDFTMTGSANFYTDSQVAAGQNPANWGNVSYAGSLPSYSGSDPSWWSDSGTATHWLSFTWME